MFIIDISNIWLTITVVCVVSCRKPDIDNIGIRLFEKSMTIESFNYYLKETKDHFSKKNLLDEGCLCLPQMVLCKLHMIFPFALRVAQPKLVSLENRGLSAFFISLCKHMISSAWPEAYKMSWGGWNAGKQLFNWKWQETSYHSQRLDILLFLSLNEFRMSPPWSKV